MKYLALLLFVGCSTTPKGESHLYVCTLFNAHGSYARMSTLAPSVEDATKAAETVRDRLLDKKLIPECAAMCVSSE